MKYIVIRTKDDEVKQDILSTLISINIDRMNFDGTNLNGRYLQWREVTDPMESPGIPISVNMIDGVSFTVSYDPNQSSTNDNPSSRTAAVDIPSTSSGLQAQQSNPPTMTMNEPTRDTAQKFDNSQPLAQMDFESRNDTSSMKPWTSTQQPMVHDYSKQTKMKYIVIGTNNDDDTQAILWTLYGMNLVGMDFDGRHLEWTELSYPWGSVENAISVNMIDGVSFTFSYNPSQSSTDDNLQSTSSGLQDHQRHSSTNTYGAHQYLNSQPLDLGCRRRERNVDPSREPSTAAKRKMDDKDSEKNDDRTNRAKSPQKPKKIRLEKIRCGKCTSIFKPTFFSGSSARWHASNHDIPGKEKRFECPVEGCDFRFCWIYSLRFHYDEKHKDWKHINFDSIPELKMQWKRHVKECFPDVDKYPRKYCRVCKIVVIRQKWVMRGHVLKNHLNFMRKCNHPECGRDPVNRSLEESDTLDDHEIESMEETERKLTDDQKRALADKMKECFSDED